MNCTEAGCSGTVLADGYCDTCGVKAVSAAGQAPLSSSTGPLTCEVALCEGQVLNDGYCNTCGSRSDSTGITSSSASSGDSKATVAPGTECDQPGCTGTVSGDGYCDTCGMVASGAKRALGKSGQSAPTFGLAVAPTTSRRISGSGTTTERSRATTSSRRTKAASTGIGAGLVTVPPTPSGDPSAAIMTPEEIEAALGVVPVEERRCSTCGKPVGQPTGDRPGRITGFCAECRTAFNFQTNAPNLKAGEVVAGQYEILGPMAHGGLGWIYLGRDRAVSNRWVVLKGLLNEDDADAVAAAVAEREFLAQLDHANIVNIYNFVTHQSAGYIVMEMVGGESLTSKLKARRRENNGVNNPLPPVEAIAYILGILPAFSYLHSRGLVYNDLKPANMMAVGDEVKLIDLGAVMKMDDVSAAIFGTQGFQAPEMATMGPSAASDLYTVGRTLAVMIIAFVYHTGEFLESLPTPEREPLFAQHESLYRFLLRATAPHPDDRFQTADEMADQLTGVLRELASLQNGVATQYTSNNFEVDQLADLLVSGAEGIEAREADWRVLPSSSVNPDDPAAPFLVGLPDTDSVRAVNAMRRALESGQIVTNSEMFLHLVSKIIYVTGPDSEMMMDLRSSGTQLVDERPMGVYPEVLLKKIETEDPWDWRVQWYRSLIALRDGDSARAAEGFSRVWTELPGETAPKIALAAAAEQAKDFERAAEIYDLVTRIDSSFVSAAFGLARCYWEIGRPDAIVGALERVPSSSAAYYEAQIAAARAQIFGGPQGEPTVDELRAASAIMRRLQLDAAQRAGLAADIYTRALEGVHAGRLQADGSPLLDAQLESRSLRQSLEETFRERARLTNNPNERVALVDAANEVRARTLT